MSKYRTRTTYIIAPYCGPSMTWIQELKRWVTTAEWLALEKPGGGRYNYATFRTSRTAKRALAKARGCPAPCVEVCARVDEKKYRGIDGTIMREKTWYVR